MAFLVTIEDVGGVDLKYGDQGLPSSAMSDGQFFEKRLLNSPDLDWTLGGLAEPNLVPPNLTIDFDNTDGSIRTSWDANRKWAYKKVIVQAGPNTTDISKFSTVLEGTVKFPRGTRSGRGVATLQVENQFREHSRTLPVNKFLPGSYPNMKEEHLYLPIPIIVGPYRATDGNGETVPAYCIDTTLKKFCCGDPSYGGVQEVTGVEKNGVAATYTEDLTIGGFVLTESYDPLIDEVRAHVVGRETVTGGHSIPDAARDVLEGILGVDESLLNLSAFETWKTYVSGSSDTVRRWIGGIEQSASDYLAELGYEGMADIIIRNSQYTPVFRLPDAPSEDNIFLDYHIIEDNGSKDFEIIDDPEDLYANEIVCDFNWTPDGLYADEETVEDLDEITANGSVERRRIDLKWIYQRTGARTRGQRELMISSVVPEFIRGAFKEAMGYLPTDTFYLDYDKWAGQSIGRPFQVRGAQHEYPRGEGVNRIFAWNTSAVRCGRWTLNTAKTWLLSTFFEQQSQGYHCTHAGFGDPSPSPDPTSKRSSWF